MGTRVLYFFCDACGGDTAAYETQSACPYCHAHGQHLHVVGDPNNNEPKEAIIQQVELLRAKWIAQHKATEVGLRKLPRFGKKRH